MKVVMISDDWHGHLGIATNYKNAIKFLIERGSLDGLTEIYYDDEWTEIKDVLGDNWKEKILNMSYADFNEYFEDMFYLEEEEIYEPKEG